jgi:hypothetical protein
MHLDPLLCIVQERPFPSSCSVLDEDEGFDYEITVRSYRILED